VAGGSAVSAAARRRPVDELARLARQGKLTDHEVSVVRELRRLDRVRQGRLLARAELEEDARRRREQQDEERRMAPAWARYIEAHCPAIGDAVIHRDFPIREAVRFVHEQTGCELNCEHRPLTAGEWERFIDYAGAES